MTAVEFDLARLNVVMAEFRDALVTHEAAINALNVFPVPDGDTGTNMRATMDSVVDALAAVPTGGRTEVKARFEAIASGSLYGARGNSGIILSQFLRGLTEALGARVSVGPVDLPRSFELASGAAYSAVTDPTSGTMLSVAAAAALSATTAASSGGDLIDVARAAHDGSVDALALTPAQLPVLARAGVVDAGGAGLTLLFAAIARGLSGSDAPIALALPDAVVSALDAGPIDLHEVATRSFDCPADNYEVMFFLEAKSDAVERLRSSWRSIGDSVAIVGSAPLWNCHIHTDDVGGAIEAAIEVGRPHKIRVTDLNRQIAEEPWVLGSLDSVPGDRSNTDADRGSTKRCAVVAIAHGEGLRSVLYSLGVAVVVDGGELMNPSMREIMQALSAIDTPEVVLLPNNPNVIGVAREAAKHTPHTVTVVATNDVQQATVALLHFDADRSSTENAVSMQSGLDLAVTGEVTRAVRDAQSEAGPIRKGDFLGIASSSIVAIAPDLCGATCALVAQLARPELELVTLYSGADLTDTEVDKVVAALATSQPNLAVEHHVGGQRLQQLLVVLE